MGGAGSGPPRRYRGTVEETPRLDVLAVSRQGALRAGCRGVLSWGNSRVRFEVWRGSLQLSYRVEPSGEELAYKIEIERVPCTFGGTRPWLRCPAVHCNRRCRFLYWADRYWICRTCAILTYASRRTSRNPVAQASLFGVGLFSDGEALRRLHYRLARASNPRKVGSLLRRIARLEALREADLAALLSRAYGGPR